MEFLSHDYPAPFKLDYIRYATVTQFIIAQKVYIFDYDKFESILLEKNPQVNRAQELLIENVDEAVWAREEPGIVFAACFAKFSQNPELAEKLIATDNLDLGENLIRVKETLKEKALDFSESWCSVLHEPIPS